MKTSDLPIATPCTLDWSRMTPADAGRFCGECKKVVRDLSTLSEREARAMLRRESGGALCVRYLHDRDGRIVFAGDAPRAGLVPASLLHRARRAGAAAAIALPLAMAGCSAPPVNDAPPSPAVDPDDYGTIMGGAPAFFDAGNDAGAESAGDAQPNADAGASAEGDAEAKGDASAEGDASADGGQTSPF